MKRVPLFEPGDSVINTTFRPFLLDQVEVVGTRESGDVNKRKHYVEFKIPYELSKGKNKVTVKFEPKD